MRRNRFAFLSGLLGSFLLYSLTSATSFRVENALPSRIPLSSRQQSTYNETIVLAQVDGDAEDTRSFFVMLPEHLTANDVDFVQQSSNPDVLAIIDDRNLIKQGGDGERVNVTLSASFDSMVGRTVYTLQCREKNSQLVVATYTIHYTISGMSFYRVDQETDRKSVLSDSPLDRYTIGFEEALTSPYSRANEIRVLVQYPEDSEKSTVGKTSDLDDVSGSVPLSLPRQSGLELVEKQARAQFVHNVFTCNAGQIGTFSTDDGLSLPTGCGYGLYWNELGDLCFGVIYEPYRYGDIAFSIEWAPLVETDSNLAEEGYSTSLGITITGIPPVVVTGLEPLNIIFREEGGQLIKVFFFNGELHTSGLRQIVVESGISAETKQDNGALIGTGALIFEEVPGSYVDEGYPSYRQSAIYITEPGVGSDLTWTYQYLSSDSATQDSNIQNYATAIVEVGVGDAFNMTYDPIPISISGVSPENALQEGGTLMTIDGYFLGFDPTIDGVFFNGIPLPAEYYQSISNDQIVVQIPPRTELGGGYGFELYIKVGNAQTAPKSFQYTVSVASVTVSQSGTTQLGGEEVYRMGDCTPGRMTAVVSPFTAQLPTYEWSLTAIDDDSNTELLSTLTLPQVPGDTQTIEIQPRHLVVGNTYELTVKITLPGPNPDTPGAVAIQTVTVVRENAVTIGAYILEPAVRSIARPETPFRLSSIVRVPSSECYNATTGSGLVFEWTGFNQTNVYAPGDADGQATESGEITTTPARLGWEFIVPQNQLTVGDHVVTFKAWMEDNTLIQGSSKRVVRIVHSPLEAVIRGGETRMTLNSKTSLAMTAENSEDPDQAFSGGASSAALSYSWTCLETTGTPDFSDEGQISACDEGFLPSGAQAESFTIPQELIAAVPENVKAMKYRLLVSKDGRISKPSELTLIVDHRVTRDTQLTGYTIDVKDITGNIQSALNVKYYQPVVISVAVPEEDIHWTYEVVEPIRQKSTLLASSNLIETSVYYTPGAVNNRKPLGIEAFKLSPFTTYTLKIFFSGSANFEDTEVYFTFQTSASPAVNFPVPTVMNGTTLTQYTATAGTTVSDSEFTYFFFLRDSTGKQFCIGGCTGYGITYFRIGRVGSYELSVLLYDSQGRALLNSKTLDEKIIVSEPEEPHDIFSELEVLFLNGDDSSWTQLAFDLASQLVISTSRAQDAGLDIVSNATTVAASVGVTTNATAVTEADGNVSATTETTVATEGDENASAATTGAALDLMRQVEVISVSDNEKITSLASGLRKILCASRPSSGHGDLAVSIASVLSGLPLLNREIFYDLMGTVTCGVSNTPMGTAITFRITTLVENLNSYVSVGASSSGTGRRRLLQLDDLPEAAVAKPYNLRADAISWGGLVLTKSETSSRGEGYSSTLMDGNITIAVVSNNIQLPVIPVSGNRQNGLSVGQSNSGAVFFAKDACASDLFGGEAGRRKRFLSIQSMVNFVTEDRFQSSEPPGEYLSDRLFLVQVYEEDEFGQMSIVDIAERQDIDPCYCMKLPITDEEKIAELQGAVGTAPNMFSLTDKKELGVDVNKTDLFFNYVTDEGAKSSYYDITAGGNSYVEVCSHGVGYAGSTKYLRAGGNLVGGAALYGASTAGIVGMVLAGLIVLVVAVVASWVVATRSMAGGDAEPVALAAHELYVERDIYGRGTIFGSKSRKLKADPIAA